MLNTTPLTQILLAIAGLATIYVGILVLSRSGKESQNYSANARIGVSVLTGAVIIAIGIGFVAFQTGPGQAVAAWIMSWFA